MDKHLQDQRGVAMITVGVRLDRVDEIVRIIPVLEPLQRFARVALGVLLKIEVMQQSRRPPQLSVLVEFFSVTLHRGRDHERVQPLVWVLDVFFQQLAGLLA